jgi:hypothetical protein
MWLLAYSCRKFITSQSSFAIFEDPHSQTTDYFHGSASEFMSFLPNGFQYVTMAAGTGLFPNIAPENINLLCPPSSNLSCVLSSVVWVIPKQQTSIFFTSLQVSLTRNPHLSQMN